jgi:hypothetical protein
MTLQERIINEAMTGKIPGHPKPFVPTPQFVTAEIKRRRTDPDRYHPTLPVTSHTAGPRSDGPSLVNQFVEISDRLQALHDRMTATNQKLQDLKQNTNDSVMSVQRRIEAIHDDIDTIESTAANSQKWTESAGNYFRTADSVDLLSSTAKVDPDKHMATLPVSSINPLYPEWNDEMTGTITTIDGPVSEVRVSPGSKLNDLISGTPDIYTVEVDTSGRGIVHLSMLIPVLAKDRNSPLELNRIELTVVGQAEIQPFIQATDSNQWYRLSRKMVTGRTMWEFPLTTIKAIDLRIFVESINPSTYYVLLDDIGLYNEKYKPTGTVISKSHSFNNKVINHVSLSTGESLPPDTGIDYFVAIDPIVPSGAFVDINENIIEPGHAAVRFDPTITESGGIPASVLHRWHRIPGAEGYEVWEPNWKPITPISRGAITTVPQVVTFDHVETHTYPSGLSVVPFTIGEEVPTTNYNGSEGWWRPLAGQGESIPAGSTSFPDLTVNGVDFFKVYYWPEENKPIAGSIQLNGGTENIQGEISGSGYLWNLAEQSTPGLQDITRRGLVPSTSGIIEIDTPGTVLFDRVRNLRHDGSHEDPFVRGEEYQVFGSGNFIEVDVSLIEAITEGFDSTTRNYELTYTVEKSSGVIDYYHYSTTLQISDDADITMVVDQPTQLRRIQIVKLNEGHSIDSVSNIEFPQSRGALDIKLPTGYVRVTLQTSINTYNPRESTTFNINRGSISSVGVPFGMESVPVNEHLLHTRRANHSRFSVMPGPSGSQWLLVNEPGSEQDQVMDNIVIGANERSNPHGKYLFHPSASGVSRYYHLQYETAATDETRLLLKAEMTTADVNRTPSIDWYRLDMGEPLNVLSSALLSRPLDLSGIQE